MSPLFACSGRYIDGTRTDDGGTEGAASGGAAGVGGTGGTGVGGTGVGGTGGGGTGVGGTGGGLMEECKAASYPAALCGSCMETHCATQCEDCMQDADCVSWLQCAKACTDQLCMDDCTQQHPIGDALGQAWWATCIEANCSSSCGPPSSVCDTNVTTGDVECDGCLSDKCCGAFQDCMANEACASCLANDAADACGGNSEFALVNHCWEFDCGPTCFGNDYVCGMPSGAPAQCNQCVADHCCDQSDACASDPTCLDALFCLQSCGGGDQSCVSACRQTFPIGTEKLDAFDECMFEQCSSECFV